VPEIDSEDAPIRATAERVYQWALEHGTAPRTHQEAAGTRLGLSAEQVRGAVGFLLGLRLLQPVDAAGVLAPVSPDAAADALIGARSARLFAQEADLHSQQSELPALQAEIAGFDTAYCRGQAGRERSGPVKTVKGGEAVRGYLDMTVRESRTEVLVCQPGSGSQEAVDEALPRDLALLARGIRLRSLYQHPARFNASTKAYAAQVIAAGSQIRTTVELPPRMILVDRTIAVLPETHEAADAVVIREPTTVRVLCAVFELACRQRLVQPAADAEAAAETSGLAVASADARPADCELTGLWLSGL
jgi:hypothetical protein